MIKVYGSPLCPSCVELKAMLDEKNKAYEYINITESTKNLKEFLKLRDTMPEFDEIKKNGSIGIPTVMFEDGSITHEYMFMDIDSLPEGASITTVGSSCDIKSGKC